MTENLKDLTNLFPKQNKSFSKAKRDMMRENCSKGLKHKFKSIDIYGQQIQLTHKGDETFKTQPGAVASLILLIVLCAYSFFQAINLFTRNDPDVSKQGFIRDLNQEDEFLPQTMGFDIAFGINQDLDPQYGYFAVYDVNFYYENVNNTLKRFKTKTPLEIQTCGSTNFQFHDQSQVTTYGVNKLMCFKNKNLTFKGDYYSDTFRYIEVRLVRCRVNCSTSAEMDNYFGKLRFNVAFVNQYFDQSDFTSPIKPYLDDSLFWEIQNNLVKKANFYIQRSSVQLYDDLLQLGQYESLEFAQVQNSRTYEDSYDEANGELINLFLRYDSKYDSYNRKVYSVLQLLGDIGGLEQSLYLIGFLCVTFFTHRIMVSSLLKHIYQVKNPTNQTIKKTKRKHFFNPNNLIVVKPEEDQFSAIIDNHQNGTHENNVLKNKDGFEQEQALTKDIPMQQLQISTKQKSLNNSLQAINKHSSLRVNNNLNSSINQNLIKKDSRMQSMTPSINQSEENLRIEKYLKRCERVSRTESETILLNIINRKRFDYSTSDIIHYLTNFLCCRKLKKNKKIYKQHFIFKKGEEKLSQELDALSILKAIRQQKLLTQVLLGQKQKMLLKFQRKNLIETSSSSQDSDDYHKFDSLRLMESKNPMIRLVIFGKIKRMIKSFEKSKLTTIDRRVLRGLFIRTLKDFDEDYKEEVQNKCLLRRLKNTLLQSNNSILMEASQNLQSNQAEEEDEEDVNFTANISHINKQRQLSINSRQNDNDSINHNKEGETPGGLIQDEPQQLLNRDFQIMNSNMMTMHQPPTDSRLSLLKVTYNKKKVVSSSQLSTRKKLSKKYKQIGTFENNSPDIPKQQKKQNFLLEIQDE